MRARAVRSAISLAVITLVVPIGHANASVPAHGVQVQWVTVRDPGNRPDTDVMSSDRTTGYGAVPYRYRISKYDVTNAQYAAFLNAVASKSDPYLLFYPCMDRTQCYHMGSGIERTGDAGNYHYAAQAGRARRPVNYVNLFMSMRFANWMNNGQGDASTETGAYTLRGGTVVPTNAFALHRNAGAQIYLPSEDEWYKAAYYDPTLHRYYDYPAGTDEPMACAVPGNTPNTANCGSATNSANPANPGLPPPADWFYGDVTDVGAYSQSASPNGTYDQGGNVFQWTDDLTYTVTDQYQVGSNLTPLLDLLTTLVGSPYTTGIGPCAILRGTDFGDAGSYDASNARSCDISGDIFETYGIRLVHH
jgi:formylglycine-generating enzyme required for sulfatase activity